MHLQAELDKYQIPCISHKLLNNIKYKRNLQSYELNKYIITNIDKLIEGDKKSLCTWLCFVIIRLTMTFWSPCISWPLDIIVFVVSSSACSRLGLPFTCSARRCTSHKLFCSNLRYGCIEVPIFCSFSRSWKLAVLWHYSYFSIEKLMHVGDKRVKGCCYESNVMACLSFGIRRWISENCDSEKQREFVIIWCPTTIVLQIFIKNTW